MKKVGKVGTGQMAWKEWMDETVEQIELVV